MSDIDKTQICALSEELISAFGQMAEGVDDNPERVSSFYITADAAQLVLAALVSLRQSAISSHALPQIAFMDPAGHA